MGGVVRPRAPSLPSSDWADAQPNGPPGQVKYGGESYAVIPVVPSLPVFIK